MPRHQEIRIMWSIGLSSQEAAFIAGCAGDFWKLSTFDAGDFPGNRDFEQDDPYFIWVSQAAWQEVGEAVRHGGMQHLGLVPHVLVLDDSLSAPDLAGGPSPYIITRPLARAQVLESINKAVEARTLYSDMLCMTRELLLERELLANKNTTLSFLVTFLAQTAEGMEPEDIFNAAYANLPKILPVRAVHGVSWQGNGNGLEFFLATEPDSPAEFAWRTLLEESAYKLNPALLPECADAARTTRLSQSLGARQALPQRQQVYLMPLSCGSETLGVIAILAENKPRLGRDQATALRSAMQHAALALRNALRFREARELAETDTLTGLFNRHAFDSRLQCEIERHIRYGYPLSLLQMDLDLFKKINDTFGHQAGDAALAATGNILRKSLRTLDIAARYGGEEFVILLPHTDAAQAAVLAERLRSNIAKQTVRFLGDSICFTASIGLATLDGCHAGRQGQSGRNETTLAADLMFQADAALYRAKAAGRNMVCIAAPHVENAREEQFHLAAG